MVVIMNLILENIFKLDLAAVATLLRDESYVVSETEKHTAISLAIQVDNTEILKLLIHDEKKRFDPAASSNHALMNAVLIGNMDILELLLADNRVDPGADNNTAIRIAASLGNTAAVSLLLAHPRVNPSAADNAAMFCALEEGNGEVVRLLLPHLKLGGISWDTFVDTSASDENLIEHVEAFMDNYKEYISKMSMLTNAQYAAFELLLSQSIIHDLEKKQIAALADDEESAMSDSKVIKSRQLFDFVQARFSSLFNQQGDTDLQRIVAIEKSIRAMILDTIYAECMDDEQKAFINSNRENLITASDVNLMKLARDNYFNSYSPTHAAWRGYDPHAPYQGQHKNLLTPQTENEEILATRASHEGPITAVTASDEVRKMMAYYYLLATDENEPEMLTVRKANFISELADLRLAHFTEWQTDSPSCYPGYLGRMLNLAYGHSLGQHLIAPKAVIMNYLSPIIMQAFKKTLQDCSSAEHCEQYLQALSWLTQSQAKAIVTGKSEYPDDLIQLRNQFVAQLLKSKKDFYETINQQLHENGFAPLDEIGRKFVKLCLRDPAHDFNFGRLGAVYSAFIKEKYPSTPIKPLPKKVCKNPFKAQYATASKLRSVHAEQLNTLKRKSELFKKLKKDIKEKAKQSFPPNETVDPNGMVLLLKVAINEMPNTSLETTALFNETFEKTLQEHAHSDDAYPQALHILQLFRHHNGKSNRQDDPQQSLSKASPSKPQDAKLDNPNKKVARALFQS